MEILLAVLNGLWTGVLIVTVVAFWASLAVGIYTIDTLTKAIFGKGNRK
jgi:hypothetical protein